MSQIVTPNGAVDELETAHQLTALDRCDACGAQAYIRVVVNSGELLFCAHHGHAHETKLREIAAQIHDDSSQLVETPAVAPEVGS